MSRCTEGFLIYEFEPDGSTRAVCIGGKLGLPRTMCPHFDGKCPALKNEMHNQETYDKYLEMTYGRKI